MATTTNLIRTLTIRSKTEGVQESAGQLQGLAAAGDQVVTSSVSQEKATLSAERAYQRLQRQVDQTFKSQEQMAKVVQTLERAQAQGLVTTERAGQLMELAARQYQNTAKSMESVSAASQKMVAGMSSIGKATLESSRASEQMVKGMSSVSQGAAAAGRSTEEYSKRNQLARYELINLSRQIQDVGVSLASGQNIFTVAIQQGSQIADVFQTSGVSAAGFGRQLLGMVSPMMAIVGTATLVVGAIAGMAKVWSDMALQMDNLSKRMNVPIAQLQELQGAAAIKGIGTDEFVKAMEGFSEQLTLAQKGVGTLRDLFVLNGQTIEQDNVANLMKVAELVRNATDENNKLNTVAAAGLPKTQEWVRLLEQGGPALRKIAQEMGHANVNQEMVESARKFQEAWNSAWASFKMTAMAIIGEILEALQGLIDLVKPFLAGLASIATLAGKGISGLLGSGRTRADELAAGGSIEDQLTGPSAPGGPLKLTVRPARPTVTPEDLKALEAEASLLRQRISLLDDQATAEQKALLFRKEAHIAQLKGVQISQNEIDARAKNIELDLKHGAKLKELKEDYHEIEQAVSGFGTTLITSMLEGATATEALGKAMEGLGRQLINIGMQDFAKNISKQISDSLSSVMGSLGGGLLGSMGGGLATAGIGIGVSLIGKLFGSKGEDPEAKKQQEAAARAAEELRKAREAWAKMTDQVEAFNRMAAGVKIGDLTTQIDSLFKAWEPLKEAAKAANDAAGSAALGVTLIAGVNRLLNEFAKNLPSLISEFGATGPMAQARETIKKLQDQFEATSDSIREFGERTTAFGFAAEQQAKLVERARGAMLALLDVPAQVTEIGKKFADTMALSDALRDALVELGVSAEDAAAMVDEKLNVALSKLRGDFLGELTKSVNELSGGDWINEAEELARKVAQMRSDAASLGIQTDLIDSFFVLSAQKLVDSTELTGDSFLALEQMLGLADTSLHQFNAAIEETAEVIKRSAEEIANAIQTNQDRLFNALHRTDSLQDQLARFNLMALREREAEIAAGGQALASLQAAQNQEMLNLITDYNAKVLAEQQAAQQKAAEAAARARQAQIDAERRAAEERQRILEEAQRFLEGALRRISDFITHFQAGAQSNLPPSQQLAVAQSAFATQLAAAQGGNRDALSNITQNAQDLIEAARRYYGSGAGSQSIISQVISQLQGLPSQVSAEQFIVNGVSSSITTQTASLSTTLNAQTTALQAAIASNNPVAIATALADNALFQSIDTNTDNALSFAEMTAALGSTYNTGTLRGIFTELDGNGNGLLEKEELIRVATQGTNSGVSSVDSKQGTIQNNTGNTATTSAQVSANTAFNGGILGEAVTTDVSAAQSAANLVTANSTLSAVQASTQFLNSINNNIIEINTSCQTIAAESSLIRSSNSVIAAWQSGQNHAMGGWITGGTRGRDSVHGMLTPGEFVVREPIARNNPWLEGFNRDGMYPVGANDNGSVVAAIRSQTAAIMRGFAAVIEAEFDAAGIVAKPMHDSNKLQRTRRGEKKVA